MNIEEVAQGGGQTGYCSFSDSKFIQSTWSVWSEFISTPICLREKLEGKAVIDPTF